MARGPTTMSRNVEFASSVQAIRPPRDDERSVMEHYVKHAKHCTVCSEPYQAWKQNIDLCDRGHSLARDVAAYIYSKGAKPFSVINRKYDNERVEIEIPYGFEVINKLVKAIDRGMSLKRREKPIIVAEPSPRREQTYAYVPRDTARRPELVEIVPSSTRRERRERQYESRRERPHTVYYDNRGSLYVRDQEEKAHRRRYDEEPIVIVAEPGRRYHR